ncbi:DUF5672 family protein [Paraburkholderia silviterrae]|uniref:DUF5672 domain-containing protein n=1 Tax=Paraburkholderia silviterrae TaxID=2528715 RepID=A0A4V2ZYU2_9BURK|nr:DUF5672 family protein [Paraburkholderia silviterrae]TDG22019.1 hypothetical protein EYW47_19205 [Paraburkholderia silviterrae]
MNSHQRLDLRDVTLCAVDTVNPHHAARALDLSMEQCAFGDAILLTHETVPCRARIVPIERIRSLEAYSSFMLRELASHISTPWVLVVQWDGYVVNSSSWSDSFREYDYIGARWPGAEANRCVGNGGFSLRSARLLQALANKQFDVPPDGIEDVLICDTWRTALETDHGIRFAPGDVADRFSYEYGKPSGATFGFHAMINMWRHVDDVALVNIIRSLDIHTLASRSNMYCLKVYWDNQKWTCVQALYERYRQHGSGQDIAAGLMRSGMDEESASRYVAMCESL